MVQKNLFYETLFLIFVLYKDYLSSFMVPKVLNAFAAYLRDYNSSQYDVDVAPVLMEDREVAMERISKSSWMYKTKEDLEKMSDRERMDFYNEVLIMINDSDENSLDYSLGQYYYELLVEIEESKY